MNQSNRGWLAGGASRRPVVVPEPQEGTAVISMIEPGSFLLKLSGSLVDENFLRRLLIPSDTRKLTVNCKHIERMNSCGTRGWFRLFRSLRARQVDVRFIECPPSVVDRFNLFPGFACGGVVESIYVPFLCPKCQVEWVALVNSRNLHTVNRKLLHQSCQKCGNSLDLDDRAEEYFSFLGESTTQAIE